MQTGIDYALKSGAEYIVTYDADSQHSPEDVSAILEPLPNGGHNVALASRFKRGGNALNIQAVRARM